MRRLVVRNCRRLRVIHKRGAHRRWFMKGRVDAGELSKDVRAVSAYIKSLQSIRQWQSGGYRRSYGTISRCYKWCYENAADSILDYGVKSYACLRKNPRKKMMFSPLKLPVFGDNWLDLPIILFMTNAKIQDRIQDTTTTPRLGKELGIELGKGLGIELGEKLGEKLGENRRYMLEENRGDLSESEKLMKTTEVMP